MQFPDIRKIDMVLKASWVKRIYKSDEGWAAIPKLYGLNMIYRNGDVFFQKRQRLVCNRFWGDVVQSVYFVYNNASRAQHIAESHLPGDLNSKNSPVGLP